jgi:hypothetical protein
LTQNQLIAVALFALTALSFFTGRSMWKMGRMSTRRFAARCVAQVGVLLVAFSFGTRFDTAGGWLSRFAIFLAITGFFADFALRTIERSRRPPPGM